MIQLIFWTIIAASGNGTHSSYTHVQYDWRVLTVHNTMESCQTAAKQLALSKYQCIIK